MTADDGVNETEADRQINSTIIKLAEQYASCDRRSADINDERKTIRANIDKLGIVPKAFVHAVAQVKQMSPGERRDYQGGVNRVLSAIADRQFELYPEEAKRNQKRDEERAAAAAEEKTKKGVDADTNPRSNPKRGGAGKKSDAVGKEPRRQIEGEAEAAAAQQELEQAEGAAIIADAAPGLAAQHTDEKPN